MSIISVDTISPRQSGVAVTVTGQCDVGVAITMDGTAGVITAKSFIGDGSSLTGMASTEYIDAASVTSSGIVTISNTTASTSTSTGALVVSGGVGIAGSMHVGENVSIGGTLTYEDVTNVDSVGVVTAQLGVIATAGRGIQVTAGGVNVDAGIGTFDAGVKVAGGEFTVGSGVTMSTAGITTFSKAVYFNDALSEQVVIVANKLSAGVNIDVEQGNVWYYSTNESTTATPNIRWNGSVALDDRLQVGETVCVSIISKPNGAGYYAALTVDGTGVTEEWLGGSAPSSANAGGYDILTHQLIKTGTDTWICLSNIQNYA